MFLTGLVFLGGCAMIYPDYTMAVLNNEIVKSLEVGPEIIVTVCAFAVAYEVGLIINRMGSVIIETILKKFKLIPFNDDYVLFNEKKKEYPIMSTLSREYALSRTGIALFLALLVMALIAARCLLSVACFLIALVYYLSCRKHSGKIVKLMGKDADMKA